MAVVKIQQYVFGKLLAYFPCVLKHIKLISLSVFSNHQKNGTEGREMNEWDGF
jgi:hypothetical protein